MTAPQGRRVRNEADARACLAAVQRSGLALYGWCKANQMDYAVLYRWRLRLKAAPSTELRLLEVVPTPTATAREKPRYTLVAGNFRVEVGDDFVDETLARLLRVACAC